MKTIKHGVIQKEIPWWVGEKITCPKCKAEYELEATDDGFKVRD